MNRLLVFTYPFTCDDYAKVVNEFHHRKYNFASPNGPKNPNRAHFHSFFVHIFWINRYRNGSKRSARLEPKKDDPQPYRRTQLIIKKQLALRIRRMNDVS